MNCSCETKGCEATPARRVFWPGREPLAMCKPCAERAETVGEAMGFPIHTEELEPRPDLVEAVRWLAQTVHQAHHEGSIESCPKNTCTFARTVLEKTAALA